MRCESMGFTFTVLLYANKEVGFIPFSFTDVQENSEAKERDVRRKTPDL